MIAGVAIKTPNGRVCPQCEAPTDLQHSWLCQTCYDLEQHAEKTARERRANARRQVIWDASWRSVPESHQWVSIDAPGFAQRAKGLPADYKSLFRRDRLVIMGAAGAGKTVLTAAMFRQRLDQEPDGMFARAHRLAQARARQGLGSGEAPMVEEAIRTPLLVLDDLGSERRTELSAIPDVIFERHADQSPLWITTGLTAEEVTARYGDGVSRRIFEGSRVVKLGASS